MKNVLNDSQKYQLAKWLESNKDSELTRTSACGLASHELLFKVTCSNMQSAERATCISLVKVAEVKADDDIAYLAAQLVEFMEWSRYTPIDEKLASIGATKIRPHILRPFICHKHG